MASSQRVANDLKAKKIDFDYLKNNNMDIADLVQMARKNKPGYVEDDDSDGSYYEEIIEEEVIEDDLSLLRKPAPAAMRIPSFHQSRAATSAAIKAAAPKPPPPRLAALNKQAPRKKKKEKKIDGSKLLLLQSAEQKLTDASKAFKEALQEGTQIVSLLEFMLTDADWDEDDLDEVDPKEWEPRTTFVSTIEEAQSVIDRLESAKHDLMGTRNKGEKRPGSAGSTASITDSVGSPEKEHKMKLFVPPALMMQRGNSFKIPDLATLEEGASDEETDMETSRRTNSDSDEEGTPTQTARTIRTPPHSPNDLEKAKSDFKKLAQEESLADKSETTAPAETAPTATTADESEESAPTEPTPTATTTEESTKKTESPALPAQAPLQRTDTSDSCVEILIEDELAKAKNALLQFAKEGAALASKLEKKAHSVNLPKPTLKKSVSDAQVLTANNKRDEEDDSPKARKSSAPSPQEGAALLSKLDKTADDKAEVSAAEEAKTETEKDIEEAKKLFLEAATQGASLVTALENKISSNPNSPAKKSTIEKQSTSGATDENVLKDDVVQARNSFLLLAQQGADLVGKLEHKLTTPTSAAQANDQSPSEDTAKRELAASEEELTKAGDSFLETAKESSEIVARLETKLDDAIIDGESMSDEAQSDITKARNSLLEAAKEGAELVARLETKLADTETPQKVEASKDRPAGTESPGQPTETTTEEAGSPTDEEETSKGQSSEEPVHASEATDGIANEEAPSTPADVQPEKEGEKMEAFVSTSNEEEKQTDTPPSVPSEADEGSQELSPNNQAPSLQPEEETAVDDKPAGEHPENDKKDEENTEAVAFTTKEEEKQTDKLSKPSVPSGKAAKGSQEPVPADQEKSGAEDKPAEEKTKKGSEESEKTTEAATPKTGEEEEHTETLPEASAPSSDVIEGSLEESAPADKKKAVVDDKPAEEQLESSNKKDKEITEAVVSPTKDEEEQTGPLPEASAPSSNVVEGSSEESAPADQEKAAVDDKPAEEQPENGSKKDEESTEAVVSAAKDEEEQTSTLPEPTAPSSEADEGSQESAPAAEEKTGADDKPAEEQPGDGSEKDEESAEAVVSASKDEEEQTSTLPEPSAPSSEADIGSQESAPAADEKAGADDKPAEEQPENSSKKAEEKTEVSISTLEKDGEQADTLQEPTAPSSEVDDGAQQAPVSDQTPLAQSSEEKAAAGGEETEVVVSTTKEEEKRTDAPLEPPAPISEANGGPQEAPPSDELPSQRSEGNDAGDDAPAPVNVTKQHNDEEGPPSEIASEVTDKTGDSQLPLPAEEKASDALMEKPLESTEPTPQSGESQLSDTGEAPAADTAEAPVSNAQEASETKGVTLDDNGATDSGVSSEETAAEMTPTKPTDSKADTETEPVRASSEEAFVGNEKQSDVETPADAAVDVESKEKGSVEDDTAETANDAVAAETVVTKESATSKGSVRLSSADIQALRAKTADEDSDDDSDDDSDVEDDDAKDQDQPATPEANKDNDGSSVPETNPADSKSPTDAPNEQPSESRATLDESRDSLDPAEAERIMMEQMLEIERQNALIEQANARTTNVAPKSDDLDAQKNDSKKEGGDDKEKKGIFGGWFGGNKAKEEKIEAEKTAKKAEESVPPEEKKAGEPHVADSPSMNTAAASADEASLKEAVASVVTADETQTESAEPSKPEGGEASTVEKTADNPEGEAKESTAGETTADKQEDGETTTDKPTNGKDETPVNPSDGAAKELAATKEDDDAVEEEVIDEGVEDAKKAFLQFAKEGASLASKLESKFPQHKYEEEVVEEEEIIEEVISDDEEESRADFLAAAKADFLNFSKGLNKKIG